MVSKPKIEFEFDPRYELVYEDGRPSYYQEKEGSEMSDAETEEESE